MIGVARVITTRVRTSKEDVWKLPLGYLAIHSREELKRNLFLFVLFVFEEHHCITSDLWYTADSWVSAFPFCASSLAQLVHRYPEPTTVVQRSDLS